MDLELGGNSMELPVLQVKVINEAVLQFGSIRTETAGSAGYDLRACISDDVEVEPGQTLAIPTGLAIHIADRNFAGLIFPRSGLALKYSITLQNAVGLIDSDYQGELIILLRNEGTAPYRVTSGDRIAQLVITPVVHPSISIVREFAGETSRGSNGFGSTGVITRSLGDPLDNIEVTYASGYVYPTQNLGSDEVSVPGVPTVVYPVYDATDQEMLESEYGED